MKRLIAALTATLCVALPASAAATGTLDQQQPTRSGTGSIHGPDRPNPTSAAQTFTAGLSGALDQVDLWVWRDATTAGPLTVEIRDVSGAAPGSSVLASATLPAAGVPTSSAGGLTAVTFASPAPVLAGTQYSIVFYAGGNDLYLFASGGTFAAPGPYAGGTALRSPGSPPTTWDDNPFFDAVDFVFKTYVLENAFEFTGFAAPIDNAAVNLAKAGQAIPVKWHLQTAGGTPVSDPASFVSLSSQADSGGCAGLPSDAIETYAGGSGLQYLGAGNWQYDWKTPKSYAGQCRALALRLSDGITRTASFQFK